MDVKTYIGQLFRTEFSRLVAVLSRQVGLQHLETVEDMVSEAFLSAAEVWEESGQPQNAAGWLYTVARNKIYKQFTRNEIYQEKVLPAHISLQETNQPANHEFPSDQFIRDSQLQMIFAVCNPLIVAEAQIGLALRILGGFSIDEIAQAFFSNHETTVKRLYRAKEKLRSEKVNMEIPSPAGISRRLDNVLHVIYLFFNEGYYSLSKNQTLRKDLCAEALRLGVMLTEYPATNLPKTNALVALMCYHSSRLSARVDAEDLPILYEDQDRELWYHNLILRGNYYLSLSGKGNELTSYHLEARIAYCHSGQTDEHEKWPAILRFYTELLSINFSPTVVLNRIYALYKVEGATVALAELEDYTFTENRFYWMLLGELYTDTDSAVALTSFSKALSLTRSPGERRILEEKIDQLKR